MTIETLAKHCLQFLEQDSEINVMEESINDLINNDMFSEYLNNIETSIYSGLLRFATSKILPLQEISFEKGINTLDMTEKVSKKRLFHKIQDVYGEDNNGNIILGVKYVIIGNKIKLLNMEKGITYKVVYNPTIHELRYYNEDIFKIELNDLGIPDEMAEFVKYFVYSDMKMEENPSVASLNKNIFEAYLSQCEINQISYNQVELDNDVWGGFNGN